MIQRIQSILLLLAAIAVLALYQLPFGSSNQAIEASNLFNDRIFNLQDHIGLLILFTLAGLIAIIAIFMFRNRPLQLTLGRASIISNIIGIILGIVVFMQDSPNMADQTPNEELGLGLPVLSIIFALFALRYINKDEKLVRSMDRLR